MLADHAEPNLTLAERAYFAIRRDILNGRLQPDQPLRFEYLKATYDLSFSPLREALTRLQAERLVVANALKGFRVADLSLTEMWDVINTRILIEGEALRQSIAAGDDDWEAAMIAAFHSLSRHSARLALTHCPEDGALEEMERRHNAFHASLVAACPSRWLLDLSALLYMQTERYRRPLLARPRRAAGGETDIHAGHKAMLDAALARDGDRAATLLSGHLLATGSHIENQVFGGGA